MDIMDESKLGTTVPVRVDAQRETNVASMDQELRGLLPERPRTVVDELESIREMLEGAVGFRKHATALYFERGGSEGSLVSYMDDVRRLTRMHSLLRRVCPDTSEQASELVSGMRALGDEFRAKEAQAAARRWKPVRLKAAERRRGCRSHEARRGLPQSRSRLRASRPARRSRVATGSSPPSSDEPEPPRGGHLHHLGQAVQTATVPWLAQSALTADASVARHVNRIAEPADWGGVPGFAAFQWRGRCTAVLLGNI